MLRLNIAPKDQIPGEKVEQTHWSVVSLPCSNTCVSSAVGGGFLGSGQQSSSDYSDWGGTSPQSPLVSIQSIRQEISFLKINDVVFLLMFVPWLTLIWWFPFSETCEKRLAARSCCQGDYSQHSGFSSYGCRLEIRSREMITEGIEVTSCRLPCFICMIICPGTRFFFRNGSDLESRNSRWVLQQDSGSWEPFLQGGDTMTAIRTC